MGAEVKTMHLESVAAARAVPVAPRPVAPVPVAVPPPVGRARPAPGPAVLPPVRRASRGRRALGRLASFAALVGLPALVSGWYLWNNAQDRYVTTFSFSVRSEQPASPAGGMAAMMGAGGASSDAGIVADFETSREMLERLEARGLDLVSIYSAPHAIDPVFALKPGAAVEDLETYWQRAVKVDRDPQTGIVGVKVWAFDRQQSLDIARAMLAESDALVEGLSEQAKADVTRASAAELERARIRLEQSREALNAFRIENRVLDPVAEMQGRARVLDELRGQLAAALVARANIEAGTGNNDIRLRQADVNIANLRKAISDEQEQVGGPDGGYAAIASGYERLSAEVRMNEEALHAASTRHDMALQDAARRAAWLVAHVAPHPAERSTVPDRPLWMAFILGILTVGWLIGGLVRAALKDQQ